jgi:hypothetical protein
VSGEFFISLGFIVTLHLVEGIANKSSRRPKYPRTLGATVALEILKTNPDFSPGMNKED